MKPRIYLDNSTLAKPSLKAIAKAYSFYSDKWGSPLSPHKMGQELFPSIQESLKNIYALIGADEESSVIFTSSGPEAVNQVFLSAYFDIARKSGKNHLIAAKTDEAASLMSLSRLEQLGCKGVLCNVNEHGLITQDALCDVISPRTGLVSLSWANGLTGVIQPIKEISALCKERGIALHVDATHVLGKIAYNFSEIAPQFLSFNGEQLHAPQGTGGLYIEKGTPCSPLIAGGLEQGGLRGGSLNVPFLASLGEAALEAMEAADFIATETARLKTKLEDNLLSSIPGSAILFKESPRLPHVTAIAFPRVSSEALLFSLNRKNVFASIGGGCFQQLGLNLISSGIKEALANTAISFSLSRYTTEEEIDQAALVIAESVKSLQKLSEKIY